jgi:glycosyltransferase involved in cell wall biosynthesis
MSNDISVILTAYNEASQIAATLDALAAAFPGAPVWVADDGSTDATALLARQAGARVVRSERMIGKGGAATMAAREALRLAHVASGEEDRVATGEEQQEAIFVLCDGDLGESALGLSELADAVRRGETDMAVAAFATRVGGGIGLAVAFARWAIRRRCGLELRAPISGQRALRVGVIADVLPFAAGFGMEIGMTIDAARAGHRVSEIELDLSHRATGRTFAGFAHRGRQLIDFIRAYFARR